MTAVNEAKTTVTVTIDGKSIEARPGELLIKVAQDNGIYIPRFCWHERMKPVGMCRMCLVEVDGIRGFPPACTMPVSEAMVCHTDTDSVKAAQDGVLELLLINHPLDCPVCDRGGECPLQDTTLAFGPVESRFVEEKRHFEKPIAISDLVLLDRERCIQCARCTRFADEIAGDPLISFVDRGDHTQVLNFPDDPFSSYFSGNVVQICPVGALTAKPYRFKARPWDLATVETSCTTCAVHCRGAVQSSSNQIVRLLGVDSEPVNQGWLCDKGRFGYEHVHSAARVLTPRVGGREASWPQALDAAVAELKSAKNLHGGGAIAMIGGASGTNESAYAWARLTKGVIGTDNVDAQLGDGIAAEVVLGSDRAQISDLDNAAAIVLCAGDLKEELPVLFLRVKRAALELGVPLVDLSAAPHGLSKYVTHALGAAPGEQGLVAEQLASAIGGATPANETIAAATRSIGSREGNIVVILGRTSLAERDDTVVSAAAALGALPRVRFLSALRRSNVHGALEAGLAPGFLPGRVSLDSGRVHFTSNWGSVPAERGLGTEGILRACAEGKIHVLVLVGADPLADFPDRSLAKQALDTVGVVIAIDAFETPSNRRAKVFMPCTLWAEQGGTVTNLEGRVQRVSRKVSASGLALDDWRIASELAQRMGSDFDLETVDEITEEFSRVAPAWAGASTATIRNARDGVVLPFADHLGEVVFRRGGSSLDIEYSLSWEPIRADGDDVAVEASDVDETAEIDRTIATEDALTLFVWDRVVAPRSIPQRDAYALRVNVGRKLYDGGRIVAESPSLVGLKKAPTMLVYSADAARLGGLSGESVTATSSRGSITVELKAARGIAPGTASLGFSADGTGASELIDASVSVTDIRVETLR